MGHLLNAEEFRELLARRIEDEGSEVIGWYHKGIIDDASDIRREYSVVLRRKSMSRYAEALRDCVDKAKKLMGAVEQIEGGRKEYIAGTVDTLVSLHGRLVGIECELEKIAQHPVH